MYNKILLPIDGSELSARARSHAAAIATATKAEVVVLRVLDTSISAFESIAIAGDPVTGTGAGAVLSLEERRVRERAEADGELDEARKALEAAGVASVSVELAEGDPGETIVDRAEALGCDLVVMSSHGRSGIKRAVLGSVTDHVVRNTPYAAVLVVGPQDRD